MPFLSPNQQYQSIESQLQNNIHLLDEQKKFIQ